MVVYNCHGKDAFEAEKTMTRKKRPSMTDGEPIATLFQSLGEVKHNGDLKHGDSKYEPLSSVWEKSDGQLLEAMLDFYPTVNPEPILDATYNTGRFWKGSSRHVWSMDID